MLKHLISLILFSSILLNASDPRITALADEFEKKGQSHNNEQFSSTKENRPSDIQGNQENNNAEAQRAAHKVFSKFVEEHPDIMIPFIQEYQQLINHNQQLARYSQALSQQNAQLMENADDVLKQEIVRQHNKHTNLKNAHNFLFKVAATALPVAFIGGSIASQQVQNDWHSNESYIRNKFLPAFAMTSIDQVMPTYSMQREIAGFRLHAGTHHLAHAMQKNILMHNILKKRNGQNQLQTLPMDIGITLIAEGIGLVESKRALKASGETVICRDTQVFNAFMQMVAALSSKYAFSSQDNSENYPRCAITTFAKHFGTDLGYNALTHAIHLIAQEYNIDPDLIENFMPKDCQVNDPIQVATKNAILFGACIAYMGSGWLAHTLTFGSHSATIM